MMSSFLDKNAWFMPILTIYPMKCCSIHMEWLSLGFGKVFWVMLSSITYDIIMKTLINYIFYNDHNTQSCCQK